MNPLSGVYVTVPSGFSTAVPLAGWVTPVTLSGSSLGSVSLASTSSVTGVSSGVVPASSTACGMSGLTMTVTMAVSVLPSASVIS